MKMIAACDNNYGIGYQNKLLFRIPEDMKNFSNTTRNNVVVMGRKTYESMDCKPLPNRINIVITSDKEYHKEHSNIIVCSIDTLRKELDNYDDDEIYIIGGGQLYTKLINQCDEIILTIYHKEYEDVDTYFPIPENYGFYKNKVLQTGTHEDIEFEICSYIKSIL